MTVIQDGDSQKNLTQGFKRSVNKLMDDAPMTTSSSYIQYLIMTLHDVVFVDMTMHLFSLRRQYWDGPI